MTLLAIDRSRGAKGAPVGRETFKASTPGIKRDGLDLARLPWKLDTFESNPVILWAHDQSRPPIGRASVAAVPAKRGEVLRADVTFDMADPFAAEIARKYREGWLYAVSVSWNDVDANGLRVQVSRRPAAAHELMEISAVPLPADADALIEARANAMRALAMAPDSAAVTWDTLADALDARLAEQYWRTVADGIRQANNEDPAVTWDTLASRLDAILAGHA